MSSPPPSNGTTTIVFTFLVSFLGVFGAVIFVAGLWRRTIGARRRLAADMLLEESLARSSRRFLTMRKPSLWDVFVEKPTATARWENLLPLSLQSIPLSDNPPVLPAPSDAIQLWDSLTGTSGLNQLSGSNQIVTPETPTTSNPDSTSREGLLISVIIVMPSRSQPVGDMDFMLGTTGVILQEHSVPPR